LEGISSLQISRKQDRNIFIIVKSQLIIMTATRRKIILSLYRSLLKMCTIYDQSPQLKIIATNPRFKYGGSWLREERSQVLHCVYRNSLIYQPQVSFLHLLKTEMKRNAVECKDVEEIEKRIDFMFAVLKHLNDSMSVASELEVVLDKYKPATVHQTRKQEDNVNLLDSIKEGTILVSHPMANRSRVFKVILIVEKLENKILGVSLNEDLSPITKEKALPFKKKKKVESLSKSQPPSRMPVAVPIIIEVVRDIDNSDFDENDDYEDESTIISIPSSVIPMLLPKKSLQAQIRDEKDLITPITKVEALHVTSESGVIYETDIEPENNGQDTSKSIKITDGLYFAKKKFSKSFKTENENNHSHSKFFRAAYEWSPASLEKELAAGFWFTIDRSEISRYRDIILHQNQSTEEIQNNNKYLEAFNNAKKQIRIWKLVLERMGGEYTAFGKLRSRLEEKERISNNSCLEES